MGAADAAGAASGGGKSGGGDAGGSNFDPSAGLGGFDPSLGMGGGFDPTGGGGSLGDAFGAVGPDSVDPTGTFGAQQSITGTTPGSQPPLSDQPNAPSQQGPQQQQAPPPQQQQRFQTPSEALFKGFQHGGPSGTPGPTMSDAGDQMGMGRQAMVHWDAINPAESSTTAPDSPGVHWDAINPAESGTYRAPTSGDILRGSQYDTGQPPAPAATTETPPAPSVTSEAGPLRGADLLPTGTTGAAAPATPPITPPATSTTPSSTSTGGEQTGQATAPGIGTGRGMQSPLEQLVGQFLHMLTGRGGPLSGLEQMIGRALGISPQQMFPQYYGGGFNPPPPRPGSGYFPPGTSGGRAVAPSGPQPAARPAPPQAPPSRTPPGMPGTPGNQPSATAPGTGRGKGFDPTLPGFPYTAGTRDQPPPWYQGAPDDTSSPSAGASSAGAQNAGSPPTQNDIAASRIAGSDTRPTAGFSRYLQNQRAPFMREMEANPRLKLQVAAIASFEHSNDPRAPVEALMNRAALTKTSLENRIFAKDRNGRTFYGPINHGLLNQRMIQLQNNPQELNRYYQAIDSVGQGTNLIAGATDQGSGTDPNVRNPSGRIIRYGETYNDWFPQAAIWRRQQQAAIRRELQGL